MAMTSASFMGMGGYTTVLATKLDKIDCSQILAAVLVADRQLLGHIKMGATASDPEVNWIEDALVGATFDAWTTTSLSVSIDMNSFTAAQTSAMFRAKTLVKPVSAEDIWQITALDGTSNLEAIIYSSGAHVTHTTTSKWIIVGNPYSDLDDASSDISQARSKRRNFTQVFERAVQITQTRKGMDMQAMVNELQTQIKYRTLEMKRELDIAVINSIASYDGTQKSGQSEWRTMQGLVNYIRDWDMDNTNEDTLVTQTSGALTVTGINDLLYEIWDAGGLDEMSDAILLVGPAQQRIISSFDKDIRRIELGERKVGYYKDVFMSDMGIELPVVLDRWVPTDKLIVMDRARVALRGYSGDTWHAEKMAKTGRVEKWQLSGQYTLEVRNADKCHGMLYDLT
jgi:hypothetical protein